MQSIFFCMLNHFNHGAYYLIKYVVRTNCILRHINRINNSIILLQQKGSAHNIVSVLIITKLRVKINP